MTSLSTFVSLKTFLSFSSQALAFLSLLKLVQHFHIISLMTPVVQSPNP